MRFKKHFIKLSLLLCVLLYSSVSFAATYTVSNTNDANAGSLRQAILDANGTVGVSDVITISTTGTLTLLSSLPDITDGLTINGPGPLASSFTISGANLYHLVNIQVDVAINNIKFADGYANNAAGIYISAGNVSFNNCSFYNNNTSVLNNSNFGGALFINAGTVAVTNSTFANNHAGAGGAIHADAGTINLTNCTFSGNTGGWATNGGGAIHVNGGTPTFNILNCTFSGNSAVNWGGAIANYSGVTCVINIANSIIGNNPNNSGGGILGNVVSGDYNIISNTNGSTITGTTTHNHVADPLLNAFADNGGATQTFSLTQCSPAVDMLPAGGNGAPATDQRGNARVNTADCGSFESPAFNTPILSTTAISSVTSSSAASGGNIISVGTSPVSVSGIVWSLASPATLGGGETGHTTDGLLTGSFASSLTSLTASTSYYVRSYATNLSGTSYGCNEVSFTTLAPTTPTVTSGTISGITIVGATLNGNSITNRGASDVTVWGICWNTSANPTTANSHTTITGTVTSGQTPFAFSSNLTGLSQSSLYYVRAYATNTQGTGYGDEVTFTTIPTLPEWGLILMERYL